MSKLKLVEDIRLVGDISRLWLYKTKLDTNEKGQPCWIICLIINLRIFSNFVYLGSGPDGSRLVTLYQCEGEEVRLACRAGTISIVRANFGRLVGKGHVMLRGFGLIKKWKG